MVKLTWRSYDKEFSRDEKSGGLPDERKKAQTGRRRARRYSDEC